MLQLDLSLLSLTAAMDEHVNQKEQQKDEEGGNRSRRQGEGINDCGAAPSSSSPPSWPPQRARTGDGTTSSSTSTSSWSSKSVFSVSLPAAAPISPLRWKYSNHRRQHHQRARSWGTVSNKSCDDGAASSVSSFSSSSFTSRALLQQLTIHRKKKKKKGFVVLVDPHDPEAEAEATERVLPSTTPPQSPSRRNYLQPYPRRPRSRSEAAAASSNSYGEEFSVISSLASKTTQSEVVPAQVLQQVSLNRKQQHGRRMFPPDQGHTATGGLALLPSVPTTTPPSSPTRNAPSSRSSSHPYHPHHRRHHSYDAATVPTATAAAAAAAKQHRRCQSKEAFPPIRRPISLTAAPVAHQRIVRVEVIERHPGRTSSRGRQHRGSPAVVELVTNTRPKKQDDEEDDEEEWSGGSSIEVTTRLSMRSSAGVRKSVSSAAQATSRNSGNGSSSQMQDENENETHDLFGLDIEIDEDADDEDEEEYFYCLDDPVDSLKRTTPLIIYDADTGVLPESATTAARRSTSTSQSKSKSTTTRSSASGQGPGRSDFCIQPCPYPESPQQERPHHPDNLMMFVSNERNILEYTANELRT